jgi:hypothetical protein
MEEVKRILVPIKQRKIDIKEDPLLDFVEIKSSYLKHLHGSYIKWSKGDLINSGGFVQTVNKDCAVFRTPSKKDSDNEIVYFDGVIFYVKKGNLNYQSISELIIEREKIEYEKRFIPKGFHTQ